MTASIPRSKPPFRDILFDEMRLWIQGAIAAVPYSRLGGRIRRYYWGRRLSIPDGDIMVLPNTFFFCPERIRIGKGCQFGINTMVDACQGEIHIGENVLFGPNCVLRAADHIFNDLRRPVKVQGHLGGRIDIGDDCWFGAGCIVLRNVHIGRQTIVGAGSVVNSDLPERSIAAGVPARVVKNRNHG